MNAGIHITRIEQPASGAVMAVYCAECRSTTFVITDHATKPARGDFWFLNDFCIDYYWHGCKAVPRTPFDVEKL